VSGAVLAVERERDFEFNDKDFRRIRQLVAEHTGITLSEAKRDMVYGRLSRRLRALGLHSFSDYCERLVGDEAELIEFTNAITTNLTSFFREPHHFEYLANKLLPSLLNHKAESRLRIWSAGCSSGEEAYSIAMTVRENVPPDWDVKILATDLDTSMVHRADSGIYSKQRVEGLSQERLRRWVRRGKGDKAQLVRMAPELRNMITFKTLNLMHDWPMRGPFDFLFCRNVVIYFNKETQRILFDRLAEYLPRDGHLFIGHSESLYQVTDRFQSLGQTIYRKVR
jgi:chemotaxis protein methyltransferase CheR